MEARGVDYGWYRPQHLLIVGPLNINLKQEKKETNE
jgi:hypothetical protein